VPPEFRGGFGFWEGFESGFLLNNPWLHGTRIPSPVRFDGYQSDVVCGRAAEFLRTLGGPWFAVVSLEAPHPPYNAPAAGIRGPEPEAIRLRANVPGGGAAASRAQRELAGYYAHIEATDRSIGSLVEGVPASTRVVVTSVHGDMHGSHGLFRKGWPHEESIRVPLLVRGPGASRREEAPFSLIGLMEAALAWADGADTVSGERPAAVRISMPSIVALPDQCDRKWTGVRTADRKLVLNEDGSPWLLHDLAADPFETRNLAGEPSRAAEIAELGSLVSS
jgi:arylsulfatase A-like enzyme